MPQPPEGRRPKPTDLGVRVDPPTPILWTAYERDLRRDIVRPLISGIEAGLKTAEPTYRDVQEKIYAAIAATEEAGLDDAARAAAEKQLAKVNEYQTRRLERAMRRSLGVSFSFAAEELSPQLRQWVETNVGLIKTIPPRLHESLSADFVKAQVEAPFNRQRLGRILRKNYDSAGYNLRRIVRDQSSKLYGQLSQERQTQAGIAEYQWVTSSDERVRPTHRANSDLIFRWDQPPASTGHPGHDIQCRCTADPVVGQPALRRTQPETPAERRRREVIALGAEFAKDRQLAKQRVAYAEVQVKKYARRLGWFDAKPSWYWIGKEAERKARERELTGGLKDWRRRLDERAEYLENIDAHHRRRVWEVLRPEPGETGITAYLPAKTSSIGKDGGKAKIAGVLKEFKRVASPKLGWKDKVRFYVAKDGRAWARQKASYEKFAGVHIRPDTGLDTIFHELVHHIEFNNPQLAREATRFVARRRLQGERIGRLRDVEHAGYDKDEITIADRFARATRGIFGESGSAYPGKIQHDRWAGGGPYTDSPLKARELMSAELRKEFPVDLYPDEIVYSTELVTMGMQSIYLDAPRFAKNDGEYFDWVVSRVIRRGLPD